MNHESFPNQESLETKDQETSPDAETINEEVEIDIKARIREMIDKFGRERVEQAIKEYESGESGKTTPVEELIEQDIEETGVSELDRDEIEKERQDDEHLITPEKLRPIIIEIQNGDQNAKEALLTLFEKICSFSNA